MQRALCLPFWILPLLLVFVPGCDDRSGIDPKTGPAGQSVMESSSGDLEEGEALPAEPAQPSLPQPVSDTFVLPKSTQVVTGFKFLIESINLCFDVENESRVAGVRILAYGCRANALNQVFDQIDLGNGLFQIRNPQSLLCLTPRNGQINEGAIIEQQACPADHVAGPLSSFRYREVDATNKTFRIEHAVSALCVGASRLDSLILMSCAAKDTILKATEAPKS